MTLLKNEDLKKWSWWKVGGPADHFCQPENPQELQEVLQWAKSKNQNWTVLGGGTNVLISDQGVRGLVISTVRLNHCSFEQNQQNLVIRCGAGVLKSKLMKIFKSHKLAPALFLSGLPGDTGGGIVMNAGVSRSFKPSEFSEIIKSFKVMRPEGTKTYHKKEIQWSYRRSDGWQKGVIYEVELEWPLGEMTDLNQLIKVELKRRRLTQPLEYFSCGSVFKNPYPQFAGELIEKCGLKSLKKGSAQVSEKHANFILNLGQATAQDIHDLIQEVQKKVQDKFGLLLETEVRYMGEWNKV